MTIIEAIEARHSVRSYEPIAISGDLKEKLQAKIDTIQPLFKANVRFALVDAQPEKGIKLGTYGFIKGASTFLVSAYQRTPFADVALGYAMQEIVLYATQLGLGTCFLGGTFRKGRFAKYINLQKEEVLDLVSPLGYKAKQATRIGTFMGNLHHSATRHPFEHLFFLDSFSEALPETSDHPLVVPLQMFRLAPSAFNAQPWCALIKGNKIHFFLTSANKGYGPIDLGIAIANFHLSMKEKGMKASFVYDTFAKAQSNKNLTYVYSMEWKA